MGRANPRRKVCSRGKRQDPENSVTPVLELDKAEKGAFETLEADLDERRFLRGRRLGYRRRRLPGVRPLSGLCAGPPSRARRSHVALPLLACRVRGRENQPESVGWPLPDRRLGARPGARAEYAGGRRSGRLLRSRAATSTRSTWCSTCRRPFSGETGRPGRAPGPASAPCTAGRSPATAGRSSPGRRSCCSLVAATEGATGRSRARARARRRASCAELREGRGRARDDRRPRAQRPRRGSACPAASGPELSAARRLAGGTTWSRRVEGTLRAGRRPRSYSPRLPGRLDHRRAEDLGRRPIAKLEPVGRGAFDGRDRHPPAER